MNQLQDIQKRVQEKVHELPEEIVLRAYANLIKNHGSHFRGDCHCDYCRVLRDYIELKKMRSRLNRRADEIDFMESYGTPIHAWSASAHDMFAPKDIPSDLRRNKSKIDELEKVKKEMKLVAMREIVAKK
jgi:hypothetical protein